MNYGFVTGAVQALMHPRGGPSALDGGAREARARPAGLCAYARLGASTGSGRALFARDRHQLLGRFLERDDPPAGRHALPRAAAGGAARGRDPDLRGARARGRTARRRHSPRAPRRACRRHRPQLRAAASGEPVEPGEAPPLRRSAVGWRAGTRRFSARGVDSPTRASRAWTGTGRQSRHPRSPSRRTWCVCWRRSIRSCGTVAGSRSSGAGPIASRRTRLRRKRKLGYYALPLLWRDRVIGWGNVSMKNGTLQSDFGYIASQPPKGRVFRRALEEELNRLSVFLGLDS